MFKLLSAFLLLIASTSASAVNYTGYIGYIYNDTNSPYEFRHIKEGALKDFPTEKCRVVAVIAPGARLLVGRNNCVFLAATDKYREYDSTIQLTKMNDKTLAKESVSIISFTTKFNMYGDLKYYFVNKGTGVIASGWGGVFNGGTDNTAFYYFRINSNGTLSASLYKNDFYYL